MNSYERWEKILQSAYGSGPSSGRPFDSNNINPNNNDAREGFNPLSNRFLNIAQIGTDIFEFRKNKS